MAGPSNPFCELADDGSPLIELKQGLVFYLEAPPSAAQARLVYDHYLRYCADRIRVYRSTTPSSLLKNWNSNAKSAFENQELPNLRKQDHWGYVFSDNKTVDSWLFIFHGYRPVSEAGKASFYRFDFDWQTDLGFLKTFARELIDLVPCLSGFGGFYFQGRLAHQKASNNRVFALARRYWGIEAHNLDVSVNHLLDGYKCVNWLTIIGDKFRRSHPQVVQDAGHVAFATHEGRFATLLQAQAVPGFCDRNRNEMLHGYVALAKVLLPLQITHHASLGGDLWDEDNTMRYLRRFTHPNEV